MWYSNIGNTFRSWTCNDSDCRNCKGNGCSYFSLTVSTEGAVSDLSPVSDCKLGDTVKLVKNGGNEFAVSEIVAIGKEGTTTINVMERII